MRNQIKKMTAVAFVAMSLSGGCNAAQDVASNVARRVAEVFTEPRARALAEAGASGDIRSLERLVKEGVPVDSPGAFGITPAWWAIRNRNAKGFEWLLAHGAKPNPEVESITIMEMAAGYEDSAFLEIALRYKPDINSVGRHTGRSPLITTIVYRRQRNLELLIKAGANLDQQEGEMPLTAAAGSGGYDFVYLMLQAGADPAKTEVAGQVSLARIMEIRVINPDSDAYVWRERVIALLKTKGIVVTRPSGEGARTKPLPSDLQTPR